MNGNTILLVEDNLQVMKNNTSALKMCGASVLCAMNLFQAQRHIRESSFDAAVIDIMLPDGSGLDLLRQLREPGGAGTPVLLLTARGESEDVIAGLELGADDYLTKPYDLDIFEARVRALLRRSARLPELLRLGRLAFDITSGTAYLDDVDLHTTQKEFSLLLLFAQNPRKMLTTEYLYRRAWGGLPSGEDTTALRVQLSNLKKKLAMVTGDILIESSRGEGYFLTILNT